MARTMSEHEERDYREVADDTYEGTIGASGVTALLAELDAERAASASLSAEVAELAAVLAVAKREAEIARDAEQYPESGTPYNIARDCALNILKALPARILNDPPPAEQGAMKGDKS